MERNIIESGGFYFIHNFDSGNLGNVERVPTSLIAPSVSSKFNSETPDYEFNIWTRPDCAGTEFENGNRTWFYFGVQASEPNVLVRLNLVNLNKQGKMYNQGMAPVTRTLPGKPQWERIKDRPVHTSDDEYFTLSFKYKTSDNLKATTFFAFTYPYSFAELQIALNSIDMKMLPLINTGPDEIYYWRECLIYSLEGRRVDLLTITSHHGITTEREARLKNLFPEKLERPFKFKNKKVVFISARVHPGETPSSFVFNGFLNLLLNRYDPVAIQLRKMYVFKLIPFLNPDGVARGHYRTDTRGVNLNRVYLNPSLTLHPTVYASRALIRYYHYGFEKDDDCDDISIFPSEHSLCEEEPKEKPPKIKVVPGRASSALSARKCNKASEVTDLDSETPLKKDAINLADQVFDLKIQDSVSKDTETSSLLNDDLLKTCLGSNVHLSTSEELNVRGVMNPLRPLRDALKNSISLLIDNNGAASPESKGKSEKSTKIGWCPDCLRSVNKLEDTMPGITAMVPGYTATHEPNQKFNSIEDYGEHQKQKISEINSTNTNEKYICTNCFSKYTRNDDLELDTVRKSTISVAESGGDSGEVGASVATNKLTTPGSTGDADCNVNHRSMKETALVKPKPTYLRAAPKKKNPVNASYVKMASHSKEPDSGLYLYIDLHGHASKKGIFMYGNHFDDLESCVECMLLPRIMSLNNLHFHFSSCNFTERNMYLKDRRDGMSREGSGRVAVLKATGLVRSYTLECNYNTGRMVNVLPPALKDGGASSGTSAAPPKYNPHIYEDVGRSLGSSILDLTGHHPNSRIPCSEHRNVHSIREWLKVHSRNMKPQLTMSRIRPRISPTRSPTYNRNKGKVTEDRKENAFGTKSERVSPTMATPRTGQDIIALNIRAIKKTDTKTGRIDDKTKSLTSKKRNILSIRKPYSKLQLGSSSKSKLRRDDNDIGKVSLSGKISKRSFGRSIRKERLKGGSSSSSEVLESWEHVAGGTVLESGPELVPNKRRSFTTEQNKLKKMRLKSAM